MTRHAGPRWAKERRGAVWYGALRHGELRLGAVGPGKDVARLAEACPGWARPGKLWLGLFRHGKVRSAQACWGKVRCAPARSGKARIKQYLNMAG